MKKLYEIIIKYKLIHLIFWGYAIFNQYHTLVLNRGAYIFNYYDLANDVICQMISVYFIIYCLVPRYFYTQKFTRFYIYSVLTVICCSILNTGIAIAYISAIKHITFMPIALLITLFAHFIDIFIVSVLFATIIIIEFYIQKDQKNKELERHRMEMEINFLKAQMNPHFLFNALNSIYFLIDKNREHSKDILVKFSSLLRYQLFECTGEKTSLLEEIKFIEDYIALEKIRNNEKLVVNFTQSGSFDGKYIAPLLLIPFVENAFKYVTKDSLQANYITIEMDISNQNGLSFAIENSFKEGNFEKQSGLGIRNVQRRLELLYADKYRLLLNKGETNYTAQLNIRM